MRQVRRVGPWGVAGSFAYAGALAAAQALLITPAFGYQGFTAARPDPLTVAAVAASLLLSACQLPRRLTRPSQAVYWLLFILVVVPTHVTPLLLDVSRRHHPLPIVAAVSLAFSALGLVYRVPPPRVLRAALSPTRFWATAAALLAGSIAVVFLAYGFEFRLPALADVYDVRSEYKKATRAGGGLAAYPVTWAGEVLGPLFFAAGLVRSNRWLLGVGVGCQAVIYSLTGFRSVAMLAVMLLLLALLSRRHAARMVGARLLWGVFAGTVAVTGHDVWLAKIELSSLFVRRLALSPGLNTYLYYEYFVDRPKLHLEYGILSGLSYNPYAQSPSQLLGTMYYTAETSVNANLWADGYANFGFPGIAFFTLCLGALFLLLDGVAQGRDLRLSALIVVAPGFSLINSALFTSLLTHGLVLAVVLIALMPVAAGPTGRTRQGLVHRNEDRLHPSAFPDAGHGRWDTFLRVRPRAGRTRPPGPHDH